MQVTSTNASTVGATSNSGLNVRGQVVDTGRYDISAREGQVWIKDRHTNTWTKLFDGFKGTTSDGDQFRVRDGNITFMLQDGTKVTVKARPTGPNGQQELQSVGITKGNQGVEIKGLNDGRPGVRVGPVTNDGAGIDKMYDDGVVLRAGNQVDDLFNSSTGQEVVGRGGVLRPGPDLPPTCGPLPPVTIKPIVPPKCAPRGPVTIMPISPPTFAPTPPVCKKPILPPELKAQPYEPPLDPALCGKPVDEAMTDLAGCGVFSIEALLMRLAERLDGAMRTRAKEVEKLGIELAKAREEGKETVTIDGKEVSEQTLTNMASELQRLQQLIQFLTTAATNISKSTSDMRMSIASNFK